MSLNKVQLIGSTGRDPEVKFMPNGDAVANFSVATSESWKDASGQKQERTEWHSIVCYRKLAEIMGEYLKKGRQVYVEGKLQTRKWKDKEGKERYTTEIIASEVQLLGRSDNNQAGTSTQNNQQSQQGANNNQRQGSPQNNANNGDGFGNDGFGNNDNTGGNSGFGGGAFDDSDMPFN